MREKRFQMIPPNAPASESNSSESSGLSGGVIAAPPLLPLAPVHQRIPTLRAIAAVREKDHAHGCMCTCLHRVVAQSATAKYWAK